MGGIRKRGIGGGKETFLCLALDVVEIGTPRGCQQTVVDAAGRVLYWRDPVQGSLFYAVASMIHSDWSQKALQDAASNAQ